MGNEPSNSVLERLRHAIGARKAITYDHERPDKYAPGVTWSTFGLFESNEIVVVACHDKKSFAIAGKSFLIYPFMIDRIFGMDVDDRALKEQLTHELWPIVEGYLKNQGLL